MTVLDKTPRLFGIVADPEDDGHLSVVAWGHELAGHAVTSWFLADGRIEVAVFGSAQDALTTAEALYPATLMWLPIGDTPPNLEG
nr:hypothetical protein GCM10020063_025720 [Dactylosporangium thailandense]